MAWAQGFDALVAPTSPTVAFRFGERLADPVAMYLSDACTLPVNMAGLPGVSIPCGLSDGLPVGLQFIGAAWSEASLFGLARGYEAITADAAWRGIEPTELAEAADPAVPTRPSDGRHDRRRRRLTSSTGVHCPGRCRTATGPGRWCRTALATGGPVATMMAGAEPCVFATWLSGSSSGRRWVPASRAVSAGGGP